VLFVTEVLTTIQNTILLTLVAALRARNLDGFFSERIRARKIAPSELVMTFYFLRGATGAGGKSSRVSDSQWEAG
jgi:hypothetical protein